MKYSWIAFFLITVMFTCSSGQTGQTTPNQQIRVTIKKLSNAIINQNIDDILKVIGEDHMCGDNLLSKERIRNDLKNTDSPLYIRLFDTKKYKAFYENKISLSDYFKKNGLSELKINFLDEDQKVAEAFFTYYIDFILVNEEGGWVLVEGIYDCP